jgi:site-specific recombinase XerD
MTNKEQLVFDYCKELSRLNYSVNTIQTYSSAFKEFIYSFPDKDIKTISYDEILAYLTKRATVDKISSSYQNQLINAVKFYYEKMLGQDKKFYYLKRPFKEEKLPNILSVEEINKLLSVIDNLKHKAIIYLLYSCGLRISELINLKFTDIDRDRMLLNVKQGKGKKDRIVQLEQETLEAIENYYRNPKMKVKPNIYVFSGQDKSKQYTKRSVQELLKDYCIEAKITVVSPHKLRHSYATHLRDEGVDLAIIQELLGHDSPKSTLIYAKLSTKKLKNLPKLIKNATKKINV